MARGGGVAAAGLSLSAVGVAALLSFFFGGFRARRPIVWKGPSIVPRRGALSISMAVVDFCIAARGRGALDAPKPAALS